MARPSGVSVRRRSLTALQAAYALAVEDELLSVDPTARIKLPRGSATERRFLSWQELKALAEETGDHAPVVWLLGTTGLRIGEAAGLQVGDIRDGRLRVARQRHGAIVEPPKGGRGRDVPIPAVRVRDDSKRQTDQPRSGCSKGWDRIASTCTVGVPASSRRRLAEL